MIGLGAQAREAQLPHLPPSTPFSPVITVTFRDGTIDNRAQQTVYPMHRSAPDMTAPMPHYCNCPLTPYLALCPPRPTRTQKDRRQSGHLARRLLPSPFILLQIHQRLRHPPLGAPRLLLCLQKRTPLGSLQEMRQGQVSTGSYW